MLSRWSCTTFPGRAHGRILRTILQIGQALSEQMSLSTVTIDPGRIRIASLQQQCNVALFSAREVHSIHMAHMLLLAEQLS